MLSKKEPGDLENSEPTQTGKNKKSCSEESTKHVTGQSRDLDQETLSLIHHLNRSQE